MTDLRTGAARTPRPAPPINRTHGRHGSMTYKSWQAMKDRCRHGRRGYETVRVHPAWRESFAAFLHDMGERPSLAHSLDRIDNAGDYVPGNCRWATAKQQNRNTRAVRIVSAFGESKLIAAWCEDPRCRIGYQTLYARLSRGWPAERALTMPPRGGAC